MESKWEFKAIRELSERVSVGHVGQTAEFFCEPEVGVPLVRSQNVRPGKLDVSDLKFITKAFHEKTRKSQLKEGDVLVVRVGQNRGDTCIVPKNMGNLNCANIVFIRPNRIVPKFLELFLRSPLGQHALISVSVGSAQEVINTKSVADVLVPVPPTSEQDAIVDLLGSLDDKIELNRQMNATLESMAQALFKSWFVDFDPVIDNALAAGNEIPPELQARAEKRQALLTQAANQPDAPLQPLPADLRALFPASFVLNEELGWVPVGWEVVPASEAICVNPKVTLKKGTKAKHVDMKALPTSGYMIDEFIEKEFSGGAKFHNEDVLLARITPCLENGKTGMVDFLDSGEAGFGSTEFIVLRERGQIRMPFIASLSRHEEFRNHCILHMVGSSGRQRVENACFDSYFLALPDEKALLIYFDEYCRLFYRRMSFAAGENKALAKLRDGLLPKLLSGQIQLPEAQQQLAEAL